MKPLQLPEQQSLPRMHCLPSTPQVGAPHVPPEHCKEQHSSGDAQPSPSILQPPPVLDELEAATEVDALVEPTLVDVVPVAAVLDAATLVDGVPAAVVVEAAVADALEALPFPLPDELPPCDWKRSLVSAAHAGIASALANTIR